MSLMARLKAMGMELDSLDTLFREQLQECYNIENQIIRALPEMVEAASSPQLKDAFEQHLETTRRQKDRIEQIFHQLGEKPREENSEGMAGIIEEGQVLANAKGKPEVRDAALIAAAQRVEHYEEAAYGTCRTFAQRLGHSDVASLLQQTLDEEKQTDRHLTEIAESGINQQAAAGPPRQSGGWTDMSGL